MYEIVDIQSKIDYAPNKEQSIKFYLYCVLERRKLMLAFWIIVGVLVIGGSCSLAGTWWSKDWRNERKNKEKEAEKEDK